jgi:hypothetical protein
MKIVININTDNAAFEDDPDQLFDLLNTVVNKITGYGEKDGKLRDGNGNNVGNFKVTGK